MKKPKKIRSKKRQIEKNKGRAEVEKLRALEKERAKTHRQKLVERLRSGKITLSKSKPQEGELGLPTPVPEQPKIRKEEVVIDEHTDPRKEPNEYKLDGDPKWV